MFKKKESGKNKTVRGFTLIELMVVIAIIAILASVVLISLQSGREAAEDSSRMTAVNQIRSLVFAGESEGEIEHDEFGKIGEGLAQIICKYGEENEVALPDCKAKGILKIVVDEEKQEFCVSIELEEKDSEGNKYFCMDRGLTGEKYGSSEHACGEGHPFCESSQ